MLRASSAIVLLCSCLLPSCAGAPALPAGQGRGLIAFDPEPPAGARVWQRPDLREGDSFTLLRGGQVKQRFLVTEVGATGHTLRDEAGHRLRRDQDLGNLGEWPANGEEPVHALTPVDVRFHWPLWVGKKWRCEFADRRQDGEMLLLEVAYAVEAADTVVVPAGTFPALRILRTVRLVADGEKYLDRASVGWYSPDLGFDVRQLNDGTLFELVEFRRPR